MVPAHRQADTQPWARLGDLDVAVPMSAHLRPRPRRDQHRAWLADLEAAAAEHESARFALEALASLALVVRDLQGLVRRELDNRADAAGEADRLCALLHRDAGGEFSSALALASVLRARL